MVDKPLLLPQWASEDQVDPASGQYNVVEPPIEVKEAGWTIKEKPNRQYWNWVGRTTYDNIAWLIQQESYSVTTSNTGLGLFKVDGALITLDVIDSVNPAKWLRAIGIKPALSAPIFDASAIQAGGGLTLGTGTVAGDQPILGGTNATSLIVNGRSSLIPTP